MKIFGHYSKMRFAYGVAVLFVCSAIAVCAIRFWNGDPVEFRVDDIVPVKIEQVESGVQNDISASVEPDADFMRSLAAQNQNDPWVVYDKFIEYAKARDINGLKSILYQPDKLVCESAEIECGEMVWWAYILSSLAYPPDYVHRWEDDKQVILSTDLMPIASDMSDDQGYQRAYIYFAYDTQGNLKYLGQFHYSWGSLIQDGQTYDEFADAVLKSTFDSDDDGLTDESETCGNGTYNPEHCTPTDPHNRDTDGDGWWDGTEERFD